MFHDPIAHETFKDFQARYHFNTIVETGTHEGHGALHCSLYRDCVCTIEINESFRNLSLLNFERNGYSVGPLHIGTEINEVVATRWEPTRIRRIHSFLGNSPDVMQAILASGRFARPFLFYLDAHWHDYWPLLDELRVIARFGLADSCIIIHDFQVPGKPFGYDTYHGQPLNMDYVRQDLFAINPNYHTFYNEEASNNFRGILYVVPEKR